MPLFTVAEVKLKASLVNNNISYLPPEIDQLESLVAFNISCNNLKYVPAELTRLQKLETLNIFPNPFRPPPSKGIGRPISETIRPASHVPRLSEMLLRFLLSSPDPSDSSRARKTKLEEYAVLPLATGHDHRPIPRHLAHTLANCVPGSITVADEFVEEFDESHEPKFITGIGRCPNPSHRGPRPVFVHPVEVRYTWETKIAGIDLGMPAPMRWRGCSRGCLDFLGAHAKENTGSSTTKRESEDGEVVQTVSLDPTRPLSFDD